MGAWRPDRVATVAGGMRLLFLQGAAVDRTARRRRQVDDGQRRTLASSDLPDLHRHACATANAALPVAGRLMTARQSPSPPAALSIAARSMADAIEGTTGRAASGSPGVVRENNYRDKRNGENNVGVEDFRENSWSAPAFRRALRSMRMAQPAPAFEPKVGQRGKDVVWVPTNQKLVDKMLDMAKVTPSDYVMDLGSGDGRTVITAAKRGAHRQGHRIQSRHGRTVQAQRREGRRHRQGKLRESRPVRDRFLQGNRDHHVPVCRAST